MKKIKFSVTDVAVGSGSATFGYGVAYLTTGDIPPLWAWSLYVLGLLALFRGLDRVAGR